jgi:hypothetical protein
VGHGEPGLQCLLPFDALDKLTPTPRARLADGSLSGTAGQLISSTNENRAADGEVVVTENDNDCQSLQACAARLMPSSAHDWAAQRGIIHP